MEEGAAWLIEDAIRIEIIFRNAGARAIAEVSGIDAIITSRHCQALWEEGRHLSDTPRWLHESAPSSQGGERLHLRLCSPVAYGMRSSVIRTEESAG